MMIACLCLTELAEELGKLGDIYECHTSWYCTTSIMDYSCHVCVVVLWGTCMSVLFTPLLWYNLVWPLISWQFSLARISIPHVIHIHVLPGNSGMWVADIDVVKQFMMAVDCWPSTVWHAHWRVWRYCWHVCSLIYAYTQKVLLCSWGMLFNSSIPHSTDMLPCRNPR